MSQRDNLVRAINDGDETKIRKAHKELVESHENAGVKPPESLDWFRSAYGS